MRGSIPKKKWGIYEKYLPIYSVLEQRYEVN